MYKKSIDVSSALIIVQLCSAVVLIVNENLYYKTGDSPVPEDWERRGIHVDSESVLQQQCSEFSVYVFVNVPWLQRPQ